MKDTIRAFEQSTIYTGWGFTTETLTVIDAFQESCLDNKNLKAKS